MPDVLEVGDVMRWSSELVELLQVQERDVLVRVTAISREADGTVSLVLTNADGDGSEIRQ
jgi:hypothetical protein